MMAVSAAAMRELDRMAAKSGIAALSLMERAGEAVAKKAAKILKEYRINRVAAFCGKGNNGGDGFVSARKLKEQGTDVRVYLLGKRDNVKNEAAVNLRSFIEAGGEIEEITSNADIDKISKSLKDSLIIDALLGTGFSGFVSGLLKSLIELLNSVGAPILAVDVPSGLNATTGEVNPIAIKATRTVSFALPKRGFYEKSGPYYAGKIQVANIGFPDELLKRAIRYERENARR